MKTIRLSNETRQRKSGGLRKDEGERTGFWLQGAPPAGRGWSVVPPGKNFILLCVFVVAALAGAVAWKLMNRGRATAGLAVSPSPSVIVVPSGEAQKVLVECLVCKKSVDPAQAPWIIEIAGKPIYFDAEECLNAFRTDPTRYARIRYRLDLSKQGASPGPDESASPGGGTPDASGSPDGPVGGGALQLPPEAPPDSGPQPIPSSVNDAPSVNERLPSNPPRSDLPDRAPSRAPITGPDQIPSDAPASTVPKSPGTQTDDQGFSLPPSNPSTPGVKSAAPAKAKAAPKWRPRTKKGGAAKSTPTGDDPPSVEEPPQGMR